MLRTCQAAEPTAKILNSEDDNKKTPNLCILQENTAKKITSYSKTHEI